MRMASPGSAVTHWFSMDAKFPQPPLRQVGVTPRGTTRSSQVEGPIKAHITTAGEQLSARSSSGTGERGVLAAAGARTAR